MSHMRMQGSQFSGTKFGLTPLRSPDSALRTLSEMMGSPSAGADTHLDPGTLIGGPELHTVAFYY